MRSVRDYVSRAEDASSLRTSEKATKQQPHYCLNKFKEEWQMVTGPTQRETGRLTIGREVTNTDLSTKISSQDIRCTSKDFTVLL
jgi:hypothetical protein